jgi:hypothetical protein
MAIETRGPGTHCGDFGGFGSVTFESHALPHLLIPGFMHCKCVGNGLGNHFLTGAFAEGVGKVLNSLTAMVSYMRPLFFRASSLLNNFSNFRPLSTFDS